MDRKKAFLAAAMIVTGVVSLGYASYDYIRRPMPVVEPPKRLRTEIFTLFTPDYRVPRSLAAIVDHDPTVCKIIYVLPDGRQRERYLTPTRPYCSQYEG
jgi:hypothetical protein